MFTTDRIASASAAILEAMDARVPQDDRLRPLTPRERVAALVGAAGRLAQQTLGHIPEEQLPEVHHRLTFAAAAMATGGPELVAVVLGRIALALATTAQEWPQNRGSQFMA
jgi:hypothetical protein